MTQAGLEPRRAAAAMMTAVTEEGSLLSEVLSGAVAALEPSERARAQRLATEALRWAQRSDRLLGPFLRNRPEDSVMNLLRLALYEMNVDGAPAHAAVNAAVSLAPKSKAGMVNAVLRNVQRTETDWNTLPIPTFPKWLRKPLVAAWGKEAVAEIERVVAMPVPLDLTARDDPEGIAHLLEGELLPTGSVRLSSTGQVSSLPGYAEGQWWVQDAAAALPVKLLEPQPDMRVLDLCAAPGGKTMQLAAAGAIVTSLDQSEARMARLSENLERTRLSAEIVVADALTWLPGTEFDAILLDAPCSATGTLRRHPDLAHAKAAQSFDELTKLQSTFIDRALNWLKPGGALVYCTCSLLPEEAEAQLDAALVRHPELVIELPDLSWIEPQWRTHSGALRIRPDHWADRGGIDGFFMFRLRKPA